MNDDFIRKSIENGKVDATAFFRIFELIWSKIKSLHSADEDDEWSQWRETMLTKMGENKGSWGTILAEVLHIFTMKMDQIEYQVQEFRDAVEKHLRFKFIEDDTKPKNQAMWS